MAARRSREEEGKPGGEKRRRIDGDGSPTEVVSGGGSTGAFDVLPDELVVSILADVAASADSPAHLASVMLTCRRFRELGKNNVVLARASAASVAVRAAKWSNGSYRFLLTCARAGNAEAAYILGMIMFYCYEKREFGSQLLAAAARRGSSEAMYSMAIIQFNGSGLPKDGRNIRFGASLCARAASRGHIDAIRELGHSAAAAAGGDCRPPGPHTCLYTDYGCSHVVAGGRRRQHAANAFLAEWFASPRRALAAGTRMCSQPACGRPETRRHEFRRCSVCNAAVYCSRACQAMHWKTAHKNTCAPVVNWLLAAGAAANADANAVAAAAAAYMAAMP
uniref:MYND-type domain-containing protein n=1 Tax=Leersia perrieri TaxID=77586 RepID=A0A0D9VG90_9ORYZ